MTTSILSLYPSTNGKMVLGESRKLPLLAPIEGVTSITYDNMTLTYRGHEQIVLASDIPEFFSKFGAYYPNPYWATVTVPGGYTQSAFNAFGTTVITVTVSGTTVYVHQSSDTGITITQRLSFTINNTTTFAPKAILYDEATSKWMMIYSKTGAYVSTNGGVNWTDTVISGFTGITDAMQHFRYTKLGTVTVIAGINGAFYSTNLTAWTRIGTSTGCRLTTGNGYAVMICNDADGNDPTTGSIIYRVKYTTTGNSWTNSDTVSSIDYSYLQWGAIWNGTYWFIGRCYARQISGPVNDTTTPNTFVGGNGIGTGISYTATYAQRKSAMDSMGYPLFEASSMYRSSGGVPSSFTSNYYTSQYNEYSYYSNSQYLWWNNFSVISILGQPGDLGYPIQTSNYDSSGNIASAASLNNSFLLSGNMSGIVDASVPPAAAQYVDANKQGRTHNGKTWYTYVPSVGPITAGTYKWNGTGAVATITFATLTMPYDNRFEGNVFTRIK